MKIMMGTSISRPEVESLNFDNLRKTIAHTNLEAAEHGFLIKFTGYDEDPRAVWEIPEVRRWFKESLDVIPWFYILYSTEGVMDQYELLFICCTMSGAVEHKPTIDGPEIPKVLNRCFLCLNKFCIENGIPMEVNIRCSDRAFACLEAFAKKIGALPKDWHKPLHC